jgi:hypothetical protein
MAQPAEWLGKTRPDDLAEATEKPVQGSCEVELVDTAHSGPQIWTKKLVTIGSL